MGGPWHDWALFRWDSDDGTTTDIPAKIICFLDLTGLSPDESMDENDLEPGLYALIHSASRGIKKEEMYKKFANPIRFKGPQWYETIDGISYPYDLVPLDSIAGTVAIVKDFGNDDDRFLLITPIDLWPDGFFAMYE